MTCTARASRSPTAPPASTCSPTTTTRSRPTTSTSTAPPACTSRRSPPKRTRRATLDEPITDTATITDAFTTGNRCLRRHGHLHGLQGPDHLHRRQAAFTSGPTAVDLDKSTEVTSEPFSPTDTGTYYWIATFHSAADPQATDVSTHLQRGWRDLRRRKSHPRTQNQSDHDARSSAKTSPTSRPCRTWSARPTPAPVSFDIYKGADCSGAKLNADPIAATPATVNANGDYTSANFNTTASGAGEYHWIAHFSGDANNKAVDGNCLDTGREHDGRKGDPRTSKPKRPRPRSSAKHLRRRDPGQTGQPGQHRLRQLRHLQGRRLLGRQTERRTRSPPPRPRSTPTATTPRPTSTTTASGAGDYHWIAHFSGDANNKAVDGACLDTGENTKSKKRPPNSKPTRRTTAIVGENISDVATLARPGQPASTGAGQLRHLQGRRLLGRQAERRDPDRRHPGHGQRQRRLHLGRTSRPPPPAPAPTTGSPTSPATPTTKPSTASASTPARTRTSKKRPPNSKPTRPRPRSSARTSPTSPPWPNLVSPANTGAVTFDIYKGADCSGAKLNADPDRRHPGHGQRQRRLHLGQLPDHRLRRRRLPLDRPLLRRRQQQSRRRRMPRHGREHDRRKSDPRTSKPTRPRPRPSAKTSPTSPPSPDSSARPAPAPSPSTSTRAPTARAPN